MQVGYLCEGHRRSALLVWPLGGREELSGIVWDKIAHHQVWGGDL